MTQSLGEKQEAFELCYNYTFPKQLPIIIKCQLRSYKRLTQNLERPYSLQFSEIISQTALFAISQIQDAILGYCHNDEIIIVLKNQEANPEPWLNNNIQSICSLTASLLTEGFRQSCQIFGDDLTLNGAAIFQVNTWILPNLEEVINYFIHRQDSCIKNAINKACGFELEGKFGKEKASNLFRNKSYDEKEDMLLNYCGIDLYDYYAPSFIFGSAIYKIKTIQSKSVEETLPRNRWHINYDIPNFIEDRGFLKTILVNGSDIFRMEKL